MQQQCIYIMTPCYHNCPCRNFNVSVICNPCMCEVKTKALQYSINNNLLQKYSSASFHFFIVQCTATVRVISLWISVLALLKVVVKTIYWLLLQILWKIVLIIRCCNGNIAFILLIVLIIFLYIFNFFSLFTYWNKEYHSNHETQRPHVRKSTHSLLGCHTHCMYMF